MRAAPSRLLPVAVTRSRLATLLIALLAALVSLQTVAVTDALAADTAPRMYQDQAFPTAGAAPTEDKPQSKLWFNDGYWWALMRTTTNGADGNPDVTIHRLQPDHTWLNTGAVVDSRAASTGDALWEGGKLYVASRVTSGAIQATRMSYDMGNKTYATDAGFPATVTSGDIESVTITRDSRARLWITFTKPDPADSTLDRVWVAHSTTSDTTWTAPFMVPVADNTVNADDISAIVSFSGKTGVMWSDQQTQVMRFAVHPDTAADDTGWTSEVAYSGTRSADDHMNLKSLAEDDQGRIYAAVKTSRGDSSTDAPSDPSIVVLSRSSTGTWTPSTVATVSETLTRPQLALDSTNRQLYVVMSTEAGGKVYYRKSPLGATMSFTPRATLLSWSGALINNATTAKAPVTAASGLVVLASDSKGTMRYYHAELDLSGSAADATAPSVPAGVSATADSSSQVTVRWTASTDAVGVASYRVMRDGVVVAAAVTGGTSYVDATVAAGTAYSYTVSAVDAAGNRSAESAAASVNTPPAPPPSAGPAVTAGASSQAVNTAAVTSVMVGKPAGVATGDVLITQFTTNGNPTVTAAPSGWVPVIAPLVVRTYATVFAYFHVVTDAAAEPASYGWTLSAGQKWNAAMTALKGVDTATPFDSSASTRVNTSGSTSVVVPGVTTTTPGALVVGGVGVDSGGVSVTPASGWTEAVESGGAQVAELAYQPRPTAGATGSATWKISSSLTAAGWMRALRPAS
ncbi:hypothetical protein SAMN05661080_04216 [Modestobacter sp. DSM 44400]|uniref:fibronectin type III domain-containing protein n=1 Tax=Modestobacter sp. DSM 44400 TaxID=1550230 RepID=UPI0008982FDA|nr:fibronectin type III domain-containing protein [Modestobacter sp. DSM 44400]SDY66692.1 hypothetical protein SAMN05661080_04216 [Modestobacter sp. DSM 44400]